VRIPKTYGQSKVDKCPFCGKQGITKNKQGVPVCVKHKNSILGNLKCACGDYLDILDGKYGPYFNCMNCGNINFRKGLEMNQGRDLELKDEEETETKKQETKQTENKEITITSNDAEYFD